jgi:hypothetical protein
MCKKSKEKKIKGGDPVVRFKNIIALWVLLATFGVSAVVWVFIKNATSQAVDKLAWRMTGVVRVLAREQVLVYGNLRAPALLHVACVCAGNLFFYLSCSSSENRRSQQPCRPHQCSIFL